MKIAHLKNPQTYHYDQIAQPHVKALLHWEIFHLWQWQTFVDQGPVASSINYRHAQLRGLDEFYPGSDKRI